MRVILVTWGFDPERQGGIARFGIEIAERLRQLDIATELVGLLRQDTAREAQERARLEALGIPTALAPRYGQHPVAAWRIARWLLGTIKPGARTYVSVHGALAELCALMMRSSRGLRLVRTVHSEREWYKRPRLGALVDWLSARWLDGEIGVSTRIADGIDARRRRVRGAMPARFIPPITSDAVVAQFAGLSAAEARARFGLAPDRYTLGSVGRFTPQKGFDTLVDALALARPDLGQFQVGLLGEGPLESDLRGRIARAGLDNTVRLISPQANVGTFLRALDLYVSSSRWEGLSLSVLEACMCGLPAVSTEVSGTADIQRLLGVELLTCPPNRADQLAQALRRAARERAPGHGQITKPDSILLHPDAVAREYAAYFAQL
jgi:glycosyltransferase involved in cell wall biosynthesis